jgi:hypothetical protein
MEREAMTPVDGSSSKQSIARIDELVRQIETMPDAAARATAVDLVSAIMNLYGEALQRIVAIVAGAGTEMMPLLGADEVVSRVLVLHGLHPDDFRTRLRGALEKLQRHFDSRGGAIEVLNAELDLIRIRVTVKRASSVASARQLIEDALYEAVPEVGDLVVEGAGEERESDFVPLAALLTAQPA